MLKSISIFAIIVSSLVANAWPARPVVTRYLISVKANADLQDCVQDIKALEDRESSEMNIRTYARMRLATANLTDAQVVEIRKFRCVAEVVIAE